MGKLIYPALGEITFNDRVLAHLQIVIGLKLRRREGFFLTWRDAEDGASGRRSIWLDPSIELVFRYDVASRPSINREWLEVLTASSNSASGLQLTDEIRSEIRGDSPDRFERSDSRLEADAGR